MQAKAWQRVERTNRPLDCHDDVDAYDWGGLERADCPYIMLIVATCIGIALGLVETMLCALLGFHGLKPTKR